MNNHQTQPSASVSSPAGKRLPLLWKIIFMCIWFPGYLLAQETIDMGYKFPIDLKPSPEAASLGRYGNIPVSYYTGTPDISIPLFDITEGELTIPVKLSYHASGIKVNDVATWVGLGWTLSAGGVINRKINHLPDEECPERIPTKEELIGKKDFDFLQTYAERSLTYQRDLQPDEFTYNFMGYHGKFYLDRDWKAYLNPHTDLKIEFYGLGFFKIKTPDGYQYVFEATESGQFNSPSINAEPTEINYLAVTSWFMSAIVSPSGQTVCHFEYKEEPKSEIAYYDTQYYTITGDKYSCSFPPKIPFEETNRYETTIQAKQSYLKEITFSQGKIVFESSAGRKDKNRFGRILDAVKVYSKEDLKKWFAFRHSYFFSDKGKNYFNYSGDFGKYRLKLDEMTENDINGNEVKKYRFEYNPELLPPYGNYGVDIWGYYNGCEFNSTLSYWEKCQAKIYKQFQVGFTSGIRNPDEQKMQACMLSRIYYPTKGYTDFEYESNRHAGTINNVPHLMGGLRIRSIKNYDETDSLLMCKDYRYGKNEDGYGELICPDVKFERNTCLRTIRIGGLAAACDYGPIPMEYVVLSVASHPLDVPSLDSNEIIFYPYVTEYIRDESGLNGKKSFEFDFFMDDFLSQDNERIITNYRYCNNGWKRGNLLRESIYEGKEEGNMKLIYQKTNEYKDFTVGKLFGLSISSRFATDNQNDRYKLDYYSIYEKYEHAAVRKVVETTEDFYTGEGTISKKTRYTYGKLGGELNFTQPTEITEYIDRDSVRTVLKYPFDFGEDVYTAMKDSFMFPVIEKQIYKNNVFLSGIKTNYKKWLNYYVPSSVETRQGSSAPETRLEFVSYNKGGKPVYMIKDGYTKLVYLWGYHNQFPVAEIKNATYDDVLGVLQEDRIEYIADNAYSYIQLAYNLSLLYQRLPGAQVKLNTFNPLWGVSTSVNPRRIYTFFDYDDFGRLKSSYYQVDGVKQLIESYDYHYKP